MVALLVVRLEVNVVVGLNVVVIEVIEVLSIIQIL